MDKNVSNLDAIVDAIAGFMVSQVFQNSDIESEFDGDIINTTFEEVPINE